DWQPHYVYSRASEKRIEPFTAQYRHLLQPQQWLVWTMTSWTRFIEFDSLSAIGFCACHYCWL
ncbi:MAG: hypothetical protein ACKPKO_56455, partial [Candidatus Fonsibacter sp.]